MKKNKSNLKSSTGIKETPNKNKNIEKFIKQANLYEIYYEKKKAILQKTPTKQLKSENKVKQVETNQPKANPEVQVKVEDKNQEKQTPPSVKQKYSSQTQRKPRSYSVFHEANNQKTILKPQKYQINRQIKPLPQLVRQQQSQILKTQYQMSDKDYRALEMLRIYIKSDSERIAILRKIGSQHTIKSLNKTQSSSKMKTKSELNNKQSSMYRTQLEELKQEHKQILATHSTEINSYKAELNNEKSIKEELERKINGFYLTIEMLKLQIQKQAIQLQESKQKLINTITFSNTRTKNFKKEKQEMYFKLSSTEHNIKSLQLKIEELAAAKSFLQQKLKKNEEEKETIKNNALEVLSFVRKQIETIQSEKLSLNI